jgi:tetratricopeptide (TPR) repeat protein
MPSESPAPDSYESYRQAGLAALEAGRLDEALTAFEAALAVASEDGSPELIARAVCNRASVAISLGDTEEPLPELRRILMANRFPESCMVAAYDIARAYELRREYKKGLFYARIARDRAEALGWDDWRGRCYNQIANLLVADSHFRPAAAEYRRAQAHLGEAAEGDRLLVDVNLAYCEIVLGRVRRGLAILYRVLRQARSRGLRRVEMLAHLDLCYAHLETGRRRYAVLHGERALTLAGEVGERDAVRNGLYLLGEAYQQAGREDGALECFRELQRRFYPDQPEVAAYLAVVDLRSVVNLRA